MSQSRFNELVKKTRKNSLISNEVINNIEEKVESGELHLSDANTALLKLLSNPNTSLNIFSKETEDQWKSLAEIIVDAEKQLKKNTKYQLWMGLLLIPLYIVAISVSSAMGWFKNEISTSFLAVTLGSLSAIVAHSFFILRTSQQSIIAIERLAEKRLAILFLKLASTSSDNAKSKELLEAGTAMFMNHHAPESKPLNAKDGGVFKSLK